MADGRQIGPAATNTKERRTVSTPHRRGDLLRAKAAAAAAQSKWFGARADLVAWAREHVGPVTEDFATITSALTAKVGQARWLWFIAKARGRRVRGGPAAAARTQ